MSPTKFGSIYNKDKFLEYQMDKPGRSKMRGEVRENFVEEPRQKFIISKTIFFWLFKTFIAESFSLTYVCIFFIVKVKYLFKKILIGIYFPIELKNIKK